MNYSVDNIYRLVGRDDKISGLEFIQDSDSYKEYGRYLTVLFIYTQKERQDLEKIYSEGLDRQIFGFIKAKYFLFDITKEQIEKLSDTGINCSDIHSMSSSVLPYENTFFSNQKRKINKMEINLRCDDDGNDFEWIYSFLKRSIEEENGLPPDYLNLFFACKLYYEPQIITEEENKIIFQENGKLNSDIEFKFLFIKHCRNEITPTELLRELELFKEKKKKSIEILNKELISAGTSIKKLFDINPEMTEELLFRIMHFKDKHLNVTGKVPIYIDLYGFFHIYFRHVEEFQVSEHFANKEKFQWDEADVFSVIQLIIESVNDEVQSYWENHHGSRFSKYGEESFYFEGDYYTFHIESDGRLSTFYKNKK